MTIKLEIYVRVIILLFNLILQRDPYLILKIKFQNFKNLEFKNLLFQNHFYQFLL